MKDGKPWEAFGVLGGGMQPQGYVQVLTNQIDFGLNVQEAGDASRWQHEGDNEPTGEKMTASGGYVEVESGIPYETVREPRKKVTTCVLMSAATAVIKPSKWKCTTANASMSALANRARTEWQPAIDSRGSEKYLSRRIYFCWALSWASFSCASVTSDFCAIPSLRSFC